MTFLIIIALCIGLRISGVLAVRTLNHNNSALSEQLTLTDATKYKPIKSCVKDPVRQIFGTAHGICTAYSALVYKMDTSNVSLLTTDLATLTAHGWKSDNAENQQASYDDNRDAIARVMQQKEDTSLNETLYFTKGGDYLEVLILNKQGVVDIPSYTLDNIHLAQDSLPSLSNNELLLIFSQRKEYLNTPLLISLPMFKDILRPQQPLILTAQ